MPGSCRERKVSGGGVSGLLLGALQSVGGFPSRLSGGSEGESVTGRTESGLTAAASGTSGAGVSAGDAEQPHPIVNVALSADALPESFLEKKEV